MPTYVFHKPHPPTFVIIFWWLLIHGSCTPVLYVSCVYMYKNLTVFRLASSHTNPSIAVAGLGVLPDSFMLYVKMLWCKARALDIHEAIPTFLKHILVPVNLQVATHSTIQHTYQSMAIHNHTQPAQFDQVFEIINLCNYIAKLLWLYY